MITRESQLLALAALAAGYTFEVRGDFVWLNGDYHSPLNTHPWNPLKDDGERYRLAKACGLIVDFADCEVRFYVGDSVVPRTFKWAKGSSADEVFTIVRAAAEIGRAKS